MSEDKGETPISPDSDLYKPTGDFNQDAEKLSKVVEPLRKANERKLKEEEEERKAEEEFRRNFVKNLAEAEKILPDDKTTVVEQDDGSYILVNYSGRQLRLVRSQSSDVRIRGYEPDFSSLDAYEVVTYSMKDNEPESLYVFDVDKLKAGDTTWESAHQIRLNGNEIENRSNNENASDIRQKAPLASSIPSIIEAAKKQKE